ncbi:serum basic protease inhibitor-like [Teleopsis dalmanni]|uniref:serum basic protease inhibitor-like n=1 Tax=Teleopsis dalmanni TaxID=139649 RepID=UPI0018CF325F|nr:serum basic protease inhibitor-like [Teleopsis dalmanni]
MNFQLFAIFMLFTLFLVTSHAGIPDRCLEPPPQGIGLCKKLLFGYHYDPKTKKCKRWFSSGCSRTKGNSYNCLKECIEDCVKSSDCKEN